MIYIKYIGWIFIIIGIFTIVLGTIALIRFSSFYNKIHAASVVECIAIPLCLMGLSFVYEGVNMKIKLWLIIILVFLLNPLSTYTLSRVSLLYKAKNHLDSK